MNPVIGYESVKAGMRLYCMIHDEIGANEFINKIHPNPIMPAFKITPNELDDGYPWNTLSSMRSWNYHHKEILIMNDSYSLALPHHVINDSNENIIISAMLFLELII